MNSPSSEKRTGRTIGNKRVSSVALAVVLLIIWLLWSGHFTPLLITFGIVSTLFVVLVARRMNIADEESAPLLGLRPFAYLPWLIKEITLANIDVAKRVLHPRLPIRPQIIRVKSTQKGDLGRVIYANSITLTPGTVSIDIQGDEIVVHALSTAAADQDSAGEMDRRVTVLEGQR
jgi:multicomponent Na+:H+ antiporter subunit E